MKTGESLNTIADLFRTTARSLAWWNRGTYPNLDPESPAYAPDHIEPGWVRSSELRAKLLDACIQAGLPE